MQRKLAVLLGLGGVAALATLLRRRRPRAGGGRLPTGADPRAESLRRKLEASRASEPPAPPGGARVGRPASPVAEPEAAADAEVEAARRRVHAEGRAAAEEMRRAAGGEAPG